MNKSKYISPDLLYKEGRRVRFRIPDEWLSEFTVNDLNDFMRDVFITDCKDLSLLLGYFEYTGISKHFDRVNLGREIPMYDWEMQDGIPVKLTRADELRETEVT